MRRAVIVGLALVLLCAGAAVGVAHGPSAYRHADGSYDRAGGITLGTSSTVHTIYNPTVTDTARSTEDRVAITVHDSSATVVALIVSVLLPGSSSATQTVACNTFSAAVREGTVVSVTPLAGLCPDGRVSMPRDGTVDLTVHRFLPLPKPKPKFASPSQRFAVLIGIQHYSGNTADTYGGIGDVDAVRRGLLAAGWPSSHIKVLTDSAATANGIRDAITWLAARSSPKTFSLLHYSGHGCIASRGPCPSGHTYLWADDNQFVSETEVASRMKQVKGHAWMDISGCESGAFDVGYHSSTRLFTSSSKAGEASYEEPSWHESVWVAMAWDRGFEQEAADPAARAMHATIWQFAMYGAQHAASWTSKQHAGAQHPVVAGGAASWTLSAPPGG